MYGEQFAEIYDVVYQDSKDYLGESKYISRLIDEYHPSARTLLDVGCGTGEHLRHWSARFDATGVEMSAGMRAVARRKLPGVRIEPGDMRDFDLGEEFDVVCSIYGCIGYLGSVDELESAVRRLVAHCRPNGLVLIEPWISAEDWGSGPPIADVTTRGELRVARMGNWQRDGMHVGIDINYMVGTPSAVEHFVDSQQLSLFTLDEYRGAVEAVLPGARYEPGGATGRGIFVGRNLAAEVSIR